MWKEQDSEPRRDTGSSAFNSRKHYLLVQHSFQIRCRFRRIWCPGNFTRPLLFPAHLERVVEMCFLVLTPNPILTCLLLRMLLSSGYQGWSPYHLPWRLHHFWGYGITLRHFCSILYLKLQNFYCSQGLVVAARHCGVSCRYLNSCVYMYTIGIQEDWRAHARWIPRDWTSEGCT